MCVSRLLPLRFAVKLVPHLTRQVTKAQVMQLCANVCSQNWLRKDQGVCVPGTELVRCEREKELDGFIWKVFIRVLIFDKGLKKSTCYWNRGHIKQLMPKSTGGRYVLITKCKKKKASHPFLTDWGSKLRQQLGSTIFILTVISLPELCRPLSQA